MKKFQLILCACIAAGFLLKTYNKMTAKPETKEDVYRRMKAEHERRKKDESDRIHAQLRAVSTPRDGSSILNQIGTVSELEAALRPYHRAKDCADAMAMAIGSCNG